MAACQLHLLQEPVTGFILVLTLVTLKIHPTQSHYRRAKLSPVCLHFLNSAHKRRSSKRANCVGGVHLHVSFAEHFTRTNNTHLPSSPNASMEDLYGRYFKRADFAHGPKSLTVRHQQLWQWSIIDDIFPQSCSGRSYWFLRITYTKRDSPMKIAISHSSHNGYPAASI